MKNQLCFFLFLAAALHAADNTSEGLVILDETGVQNLRLETVEAEETDFESTVFALGRIQALPDRVAAVSSRISGRIIALNVIPGELVKAGDEVAKVESRQPGDPPPVIALKAPIAGLVTQVELRLGDPVEPERSVMEITDLSEVYAVARVPEQLAGRLQPGTTAHIQVAALPDKTFEGKLLRFGTTADRQSGTIDTLFHLLETGGQLRADMRAEFSIVLSRREGVISVPRAALQGEGGNRFVYVKDFELPNAFLKTPVTVGEINDRHVEILSGLLPADEVVTRGAYSLSFAGAGSVSLKEALDAAHGHEHAEDGSELTSGQQAGHDDHEHGHEHSEEGVSVWWKYAAIALALLLVVALLTRKSIRHDEHDSDDANKGAV